MSTQDQDVRLLAAAADPTRLAILRELATSDEVCACDFTDCCTVSQPTVSHHLRVLREAGWVESERRGSWVWYRMRPEAAARLSRLAAELGQVGATLKLPVLAQAAPGEPAARPSAAVR